MNRTAAYLKLIGAMLIYGTIGIFRRWIPLGSGFLAFARGVMGALFLLLFIKLTGRKLRHGIGTKKALLLAVTGGLIGLNWVFLFEAYNYTTVPIATLCYYMAPTIIILLSPIFFPEKLTAKKLLCVAVSVAGMVLISGVLEGGAGSTSVIGILYGLAAAVIYAVVVILNKKLPIEDAYEKTVIQLSGAAVVLIPYLLLTGGFAVGTLTPLAVIMLLVVGIVHTGIAYALYFGSLQELPTQSAAVLSYIDPVSALILSALILHENMTVYGIIGAVLIIGAAVVSELGNGKAEEPA